MSLCDKCPNYRLSRCTITNKPVILMDKCPESLWPEKTTRVLWLMGDFARGGTSRYTKELLEILKPLPIKFHVMRLSDQFLDEPLLRMLPAEHSLFTPQKFDEQVALSDVVSCIGISKYHAMAEECLKKIAGKCFAQVHGTCQYTRDLISFNGQYTDRFVACSSAASAMLPSSVTKIVPPFPLDFNRIIRRQPKSIAKLRWDVERLVVFAGRISEDKNIPGIIDAIAQLPEDVHFLCVGTGYSQETVWAYGRAKLGSRFHIERWISEPTAYLDAADCFICMSPSEGGPFTVMEAVAHGTPVVSTAVGVIPEYVLKQPGCLDRSIIFPYKQPEDILRAMALKEDALAINNFVLARHNPGTIREVWSEWLTKGSALC